jgi:hypothetical protein
MLDFFGRTGHDRFINSGPVDAVVGRGMTAGYMGAATGIAEPSGITPPWPGVGSRRGNSPFDFFEKLWKVPFAVCDFNR